MISTFLELMIYSVLIPQRAGQTVLKVNITRSGVIYLLTLVIVLNAITLLISEIVNPPMPITTSTMFLIQLATLATTIVGTYFIGRMFGGKASFENTTIIMCWMNLIIVIYQFIQIVLLEILELMPWLGFVGFLLESILASTSIFLFFWLYVHFTTMVHSFKSAIKVFGGVLLTIFVIAFGLTSIMFVN